MNERTLNGSITCTVFKKEIITFGNPVCNVVSRMHLLVTGGTGLLGQALRHHLSNCDGKRLKQTYLSSKDCDLRDESQVRAILTFVQPTHVIHLAARVGGLFDNLSNNYDFYDSNVRINSNVLKICNDLPSVKKVISCMSTCIFPAKATLPLTVAQLHNGLPHFSNIGYSFSKRMIDVQNRILYGPEKTFTGIVLTNLFGPHDNFNLETAHVIPALIHKCYLAKLNNEPSLHLKGSGKAVRQFLYAPDAAQLIQHVLNHHDEAEPLILTPPEEYSISQVVDKIVAVIGYVGDVVYECPNASGDQDGQERKTADGTQILNMLKDKKIEFKFTNFDTALNTTVQWFIENYETCRR
jgi:GDP-L-fucose synthase